MFSLRQNAWLLFIGVYFYTLLFITSCNSDNGMLFKGQGQSLDIGDPVLIDLSDQDKPDEKKIESPSQSTKVKMVRKNGVWEIQAEINGIPMDLIFDTGASVISISQTEAIFLYKQGTLTDDDIIGSQSFIDANGDVSEGTKINLKSVKLGDRVLENVEASVVHNLGAPLLMGQTALEKFGKITIDYEKGEIIFE